VATFSAFPPQEYGSGRASLTQADRAFLDNPPAYEEAASALASLPPPAVVRAPSLARRILSKLLFVLIAGSACAVLGMAIMQMLGHAPFLR
jgi:hypothetical protein